MKLLALLDTDPTTAVETDPETVTLSSRENATSEWNETRETAHIFPQNPEIADRLRRELSKTLRQFENRPFRKFTPWRPGDSNRAPSSRPPSEGTRRFRSPSRERLLFGFHPGCHHSYDRAARVPTHTMNPRGSRCEPNMTEQKAITISVEGREVKAPPSLSIVQAMWESGQTLVEGIGCLGQGVCGSCRVFVRRKEENEVKLMLACETLIEDGMQVSFAHFIEPKLRQQYQLEDFQDTWSAVEHVSQTFPEAAQCRHCGGCDASCPRDIEVERGVTLAAEGRLPMAGRLFDECIMCNLCTLACPEYIAPNHLAQLCRRLTASLLLRPANLMQRLVELERGQLQIEDEALGKPEEKP